jgi:hypothetical protein
MLKKKVCAATENGWNSVSKWCRPRRAKWKHQLCSLERVLKLNPLCENNAARRAAVLIFIFITFSRRKNVTSALNIYAEKLPRG